MIMAHWGGRRWGKALRAGLEYRLDGQGNKFRTDTICARPYLQVAIPFVIQGRPHVLPCRRSGAIVPDLARVW